MPHAKDDVVKVVLFPNERKEAGSKHPDFSGFVNVLQNIKAGTELRLVCWKGESKNGKKMLSGPGSRQPTANEPSKSSVSKKTAADDIW